MSSIDPQAEILRSLAAVCQDGAHYEVRTLANRGAGPSRTGRYPDDALALACFALAQEEESWNLYLTLNPLAESHRPGKAARDRDVARRLWLPIDVDPVRQADTASTDAEKKKALAATRAIKAALEADGFGAPLVADSGNGYHLLYPVDLPNDEESLALVQRFLTGLAQLVNDDAVKVDTSVSNASRVLRLWGTLARKGQDTPERPWRRSRLLVVPEGARKLAAATTQALRTLLARWGMAGQSQPARPAPRRGEPTEGGLTVGDDFDLRGGWAEILEEHGWKAVGRLGTEIRWARPGKSSGHSATTGHGKGPRGEDLLHVFSDQAAPFEPGKNYGKFRAFALLNHQGDLSAAARVLREKGYGPRPVAPSATPSKDLPAKDEPARERPRTQAEEREVAREREINAIPLPPDWPRLRPEAMHGVLGEIVRIIEPETEADAAGILLQLLAASGNAIGRGPFFHVDGSDHRVNFFVATVGATGSARKGTGWNRARQVMKMASEDWANKHTFNGLHSGEGLIFHVRDRRVRHKRDGSEEVLDEGSDIKNAMIVESEFGSVIKRMSGDRNTLSAILRQAWDGTVLSSLTKHSPDRANDAHVSIIGHITEAELEELLKRTELLNGFGNRFLWALVRRARLLPHGGKPLRKELEQPARALGYAITRWAHPQQITWEPPAARDWEGVYGRLTGDGRPGLCGAATRRAEAQTLRLAMLYALLDCKEAIGCEHLQAALAIWDYCETSALRLFGAYEPEDTLPAEILKILQSAGADGRTRTELNRHLGGHVKAAELVRCLAILRERGQANFTTEPTAGRPVERWRACGKSQTSGETNSERTCASEEVAEEVRNKGLNQSGDLNPQIIREQIRDVSSSPTTSFASSASSAEGLDAEEPDEQAF